MLYFAELHTLETLVQRVYEIEMPRLGLRLRINQFYFQLFWTDLSFLSASQALGFPTRLSIRDLLLAFSNMLSVLRAGFRVALARRAPALRAQ